MVVGQWLLVDGKVSIVGQVLNLTARQYGNFVPTQARGNEKMLKSREA